MEAEEELVEPVKQGLRRLVALEKECKAAASSGIDGDFGVRVNEFDYQTLKADEKALKKALSKLNK